MTSIYCKVCGGRRCEICEGCTKEGCPSLVGYPPCCCAENAANIPICPECGNRVCPDCRLCYEPDCDQQACECITDHVAKARFRPNVFTFGHDTLLHWMQTPPHDVCGIEETRLKATGYSAPELYAAQEHADFLLWWLIQSGVLTPEEVALGVAACVDEVALDCPPTHVVHLYSAMTRIRQWARGEITVSDLYNTMPPTGEMTYAAYYITRAVLVIAQKDAIGLGASLILKGTFLLAGETRDPEEAHRRMCAILRTKYPLQSLQERAILDPTAYAAPSGGRNPAESPDRNPSWDVTLSAEDEKILDSVWDEMFSKQAKKPLKSQGES